MARSLFISTISISNGVARVTQVWSQNETLSPQPGLPSVGKYLPLNSLSASSKMEPNCVVIVDRLFSSISGNSFVSWLVISSSLLQAHDCFPCYHKLTDGCGRRRQAFSSRRLLDVRLPLDLVLECCVLLLSLGSG